MPLWRRIVLTLIVLAIVGLGVRMLIGYLVEARLDSTVTAIHKAGYPVSFEQLAPSENTTATGDASVLYTSALSSLPAMDMEGIIKALSVYRNAITAKALDKLPREFQPAVRIHP